ncbi:MAG TPA: hypothetical protein VFA18_13880 [Gemmataceae bacterium]|nr:hypothetical protein [Gemmataceae bacterium]
MRAHLTSWQRLAVALVVGLGLMAGHSAAADQGKVTVEKVEYKGWKNNLRLSNGEVELIVTLDVGPRVISYRLHNGPNVFKVFEEQAGKTGGDEWVAYGGHRVWAAPEDLTRTYAPDNGAVKYQKVPQLQSMPAGTVGVRFTPAADTAYGVQRELEVYVEPTGSRVTVRNLITNIGDKQTQLAVWALSIMAPGGTEVIPLPPHHPHPGPPKNAKSAADFAPNLVMVLWPYFDFTDPRWHFGSRYITLKQSSDKGPTKIGLSQNMGWVGYLNNGTLFVKKFHRHQDRHYPDHGVNFETFSNQEMQEIETLGPLVHLDPNKTAEHTEHWELFANVGQISDEAAIDKEVRDRIKK